VNIDIVLGAFRLRALRGGLPTFDGSLTVPALVSRWSPRDRTRLVFHLPSGHEMVNLEQAPPDSGLWGAAGEGLRRIFLIQLPLDRLLQVAMSSS
jgi:hypothetical protein